MFFNRKSDPVISYLKILDNFPNPIWRAGVDSKCDFFNKSWLEFTGRTLEQEKGDGWAQGVHPEDLKACVDTYIGKFAKREPFQMEYRLMHKDGTYHWILDCGAPFYDEKGDFQGYIGSCYDINERKISEQKLIEQNNELERINKLAVDREIKMVELKKMLDEARKAPKTAVVKPAKAPVKRQSGKPVKKAAKKPVKKAQKKVVRRK